MCKRAGQIDGDELVPLGGLGLDEGPEHVPAGVVDQHVDRAELGFDRGDRCIDVGPLGDVAGEGFGDPAGGPDVGGDLLGGVEIEVEHGDLGAFRANRRHVAPPIPPPPPVTTTTLPAKRVMFALPCGFPIAAAANLGQDLDTRRHM